MVNKIENEKYNKKVEVQKIRKTSPDKVSHSGKLIYSIKKDVEKKKGKKEGREEGRKEERKEGREEAICDNQDDESTKSNDDENVKIERKI